MRKTFIYLVLIVTMVIVADVAYGQCAMCRATVESNVKTATGAGKGLNNGILYLMSIPYIIFCFIAYFWYRSSRGNAQKQEKIWSALKRSLS